MNGTDPGNLAKCLSVMMESEQGASAYHLNIFFDILNIYFVWGSLHQDASSFLRQGYRRQKDHNGNKYANGRVHVVAFVRFDSPNDKRRYNYANVVDRIAYHV